MKNLKTVTCYVLIFMLLAFASGCTKEDDGSGDGGTDITGVWQRYGSPKGYQTDLAIGNIPGEPSDRVYMCEHPGSPSAGLYKGTISGNTITWDAAHGLPNAVFNSIGNGERSLYFGVGAVSDAGKYKKGIWTNTCGELKVKTTPKIAVGFDPSDSFYGRQLVSVKIENVDCPLHVLNSVVMSPDCESVNGYIEAPATTSYPDYYKVEITYRVEEMWPSGWQTKTDKSSIPKLTLINGCNKFKVTDPMGRFVLEEIY